MTRLLRLGLLVVVLAVLGSSPLVGQTSNSAQSDADVVRATYAKLVFASRVTEISESAGQMSDGNLEEVLLRPHLEIVLSGISTGPVSDLRSVALESLVTKPSGRTLQVTPISWAVQTTDGRELRGGGASLHWLDAGHLAEDWDVPLGRLIESGVIDSGYTRYASFAAKVTYSHETRQYQALFLFGHDVEGRPTILPLDHIVGGSALKMVIEAPSIPDPLLAPDFRYRPETADLVRSMRAPAGCSQEPVTQMCCDEENGRCGVGADQLRQHGFLSGGTGARASSREVGTPQQTSCDVCSGYNYSATADPTTDGVEQQLHITGYHEGFATFTPRCTYSLTSGKCSPLCKVAVSSASVSESGLVKTSCHATASSQNNKDTYGTGQCESSWGYGVVPCLFCACGLSVSVGLPTQTGSATVTVSGGSAIWTWGQGVVYPGCTGSP
jgi:hypothetical protein